MTQVNCSPSSVQSHLCLEATKSEMKSTISSINLELNSPVYNPLLNHYPMTLLPKNLLDMRNPFHSPSITHYDNNKNKRLEDTLQRNITILASKLIDD